MLQSDLFQTDSDIEWKDLGDGVQRKIFGYEDRVMMVKVKFEKGAIGTLHEHHHTQVSYFESGVFEVTINGQKRILKAGDGFFVPPNAMHGVVCLEAGMIVDVFTPHRADFL